MANLGDETVTVGELRGRARRQFKRVKDEKVNECNAVTS